jgi:hypothetical protein
MRLTGPGNPGPDLRNFDHRAPFHFVTWRPIGTRGHGGHPDRPRGRGRKRPAIYLACLADVRRRLAVIASHSDSNRMTIPSRACSPPIHLLLSPAAASAV